MQICVRKIPVPITNKKWTFVCEPLGDVHFGARGFDEEEFKRHVARIKADGRYTILMGDLCDCIFPVAGEKRFDLDTIDPRVLVDREYGQSMAEKEYDSFYELVKPIKKNILCTLSGNHDDIMRSKLAMDWVHDLCKKEKLNTPYMGLGGFVRLYFTEGHSNKIIAELTIRAIHGAYSGLKAGGHINRLEDAAKFWAADVYLVGHSHQCICSIQEYLTIDNEHNLVHRKRLFGVTGTFLDGFKMGTTSYAELKDKPPTRVGTIAFEFNPRTKNLYLHQ